MNNNQVQFGVVKFFNAEKNFGFITINNEPPDVWFSLDSQRVVVDGPNNPQFGKEAPKESPMPQTESHVVVAVMEEYELFTPPGHRILQRRVSATGWNFAFAWSDAKRRIASRPVYEVVRFSLYKDKPTSGGTQRESVAVGTAEQLQAQSPRGTDSDQFAAEKHLLDFTFRCRFFRKEADGRLTQYPDPRPLWEGTGAEEFVPVNDYGVLLATASEIATLIVSDPITKGNGAQTEMDRELEELARSTNGRRAGTKTQRPGQVRSHAELVTA